MDPPSSHQSLAWLLELGDSMFTDGLREALIELVARFMPCLVVGYRELADQNHFPVHTFKDEQKFELVEPDYAPDVPHEIVRIEGMQYCPQPFVMEVPAAVVSTNQGLLIPREGTYLRYDYCRTSTDGRRREEVARDLVMGLRRGNLPNLRASVSANPRRIELCVPLLATHATNYTHWTQECLTQLPAIEAYERATGSEPMILIPPDPPAFIPESLDHLGFSSERYREWRGGQARSERLVLPSMRRCWDDRSGGFVRDPAALRWVRQRAVRNLREDDLTDSNRVFISRQDAASRRIVNRAEVADYLADRGFETQILSQLPYTQQVRLFAKADFVVGAHGAGMINSIYSADCPVLELFGDHYLPANYEVAQALDNPYGCLSCEPDGQDLVVDVDALGEAMDELEASTDGS